MASGGESGRRLELFIETLTGTAFELQASPLETIMAIKAKIQHLEGIPVCQQHLIWGSQELRDECSLQECQVRDGATLRLVLGMRGGPLNAKSAARGADPKSALIQAELLEANREELLQASEGRPLTVVVFHDGDQVHWYTVIQDDLARSAIQSPSLSVESEVESEREISAGRKLEDRLMRQKVAALQKQLRAMGLNKKGQRRKLPPSSSGSVVASSSDRRLESGCSSGFLPPLHGGTNRADSRGRGLASSGCPTPQVSRLPAIRSASNRHRRRMMETPPQTTLERPPSVVRHQRHHIIRPACNPRRRPTPPSLHRKPPRILPENSEELAGFLPRLAAATRQRIFASQAGTPTTADGQQHLDRWLNRGRPRTTPSKWEMEMDGRTVSLSRLVSDVGSWRDSPKDSSMLGIGAIVAAARKPVSGASKNRRENEEKGHIVVPSEEVLEESRLPPIRVKKKKSKRCCWCNKKTGLASSYICRCGKNYCASHRYPEAHRCPHNFKAEGRRLLQLSHPLVAASKLPKI